MSIKILVLGHGRHGKDTVADIITDLTGLTLESSSRAALKQAVWPAIGDWYEHMEQCFEDRVNYRNTWKELITKYNTPDKGRLCKEILERFDGYVGMRCDKEYAAVEHLFDLVLWVDASDRCPPDPSMAIEFDPAGMIRIDNNGPERDLMGNVDEALSWSL